MGFREGLARELKALTEAWLYFACWLGGLILIKKLLLAEYRIEFKGLSVALVGALVLSKVVLILEHVSLGAWVKRQAAWVDVVVRTAVYSVGVVVVLILEKAFEGRHEYGGFVQSLTSISHRADIHHVWVNAICIGGALLSYNVLSVIRRNLGEGSLIRMLLIPVPEERPAPNVVQPAGGEKRPGTRGGKYVS